MIHGKRIHSSVFTGIWGKLIWTLIDNVEGFQTSVEEISADMVEIARELELEEVTELVKSYDKILTDEWINKESSFLSGSYSLWIRCEDCQSDKTDLK